MTDQLSLKKSSSIKFKQALSQYLILFLIYFYIALLKFYNIKEGKVEIKCKLLSSMFPEKVVFDGNSYRTNSYNSVLDLIYKQTNELQGAKTKNGESFSTFSASVPRADTQPMQKHPIKRI